MASHSTIYMAALQLPPSFKELWFHNPIENYVCMESKYTGQLYLGKILKDLPLFDCSLKEVVALADPVLKTIQSDGNIRSLMERARLQRVHLDIFLLKEASMVQSPDAKTIKEE